MNQSERKHTFTLFFLLLLFSYVSTNTKLNDGEFTSTISENLYFDSKLQDFTEYSLGIKWESGHPSNTYCSPCISDINKDGELEIIVGGICLDKNGETLWSNVDQVSSDTIVADINADSSPEIIYSLFEGIRCRDANGNLLWSYEDDSRYLYPVRNIALGDLNSDGNLEIVACTNNGYIICLDCNGTLLWEFDDGKGNPPNQIDVLSCPVIVDLDSDGTLEILYTHRDLVCLSSDGNLKWSTVASSTSHISIGVGNFDSNTSTIEIIIYDYGGISCYNMNGAKLYSSINFSNIITGFILADLNDDFISEVILTTDRHVYCIDNTGEITWQHNAQRDLRNQPAVLDINGDDNLEILFGSGTYTLSCLDQDGLFLWNFALPKIISDEITYADIDGDGKVEIFLNVWDSIYCIEIQGTITSGKCQYFCSGGDPSRTNYLDSDGDYLVDCMENHFSCDQEQEDMDGDGLKDGFEIYLYNTNPTTNDTDNDSLPDMWEVYSKLEATRNNTFEDPDGDGLTNIEEYTFSTDPLSYDTDNDDLNDHDEVYIYPTSPTDNDTDNDNLTDGDEILIYNTDPLKADSDDDGIPDGWEVDYGFNPLFNDSYLDNDSDGLNNLLEFEYLSNPSNNDTDNDILLDGVEVFVYFTSPILNDTDFDELLDWDEIFVYFTMPNKNDTEDDGMPDGWEVSYLLDPLEDDSLEDPDSDNLLNIEEFGNNTNPNSSDTDDDGMPDGWEVQYNLNPIVNDALGDPDRDELQNVIEFNIGTNPRKRDTDDDGMPDGWEYNNNLDPSTADDSDDSDEDELSNLLEYLHNTDPNLNGICLVFADSGFQCQ